MPVQSVDPIAEDALGPSRRRFLLIPPAAAGLLVGALLLMGSGTPGSAPALAGFSEAGADDEHAREARFDQEVVAADLEAWMRRLSAHPHHLGSARDRENVEWIAARFREWGFETRVEEFSVPFPTPVARSLEMVSPTAFRARLAEPGVPGAPADPEALPVYNAYSPDGDVTGDLVYVNYGVPADYEELARRGIEVRGRVVIARYGGSWRGIKPKVAAEHGAAACLIYSDPRDDGFFQGDPYPAGPWRPAEGAQRGSILDTPVYPGDPLTPGVGATTGAPRRPREQAATLPRIPTLPLSFADARPLLAALGGPVAPEPWRGAAPFTQHLGPGPARVHLTLRFAWSTVPVRDVIATLRGGERADQWVLRGNHQDAWVAGASDPLSGTVALLAEARALGRLHESGWTPRRTIVYAAWDGEEQGLMGSTEWVEAHAEELRAHAVAYLNGDTTGRGFLGAGGSHQLEGLVNEAARDLPDPQTGGSVLERWRARRIEKGTAEERAEARGKDELRISPLGSGSDYTPFLQHLGVAALDVRFGGEDAGGVYHSAYDSYDHFTRFVDPGFAYTAATARLQGRLVLRLAEAEVLPFGFAPLARALSRYAREIEELASDLRARAEEDRLRAAEGTTAAAADPRQGLRAPSPRPAVPYLSLAPLLNSVTRLEQSARRYDEARAAALALPPERQRELDRLLARAEPALTRADGLPGRPWYAHQVYAPGLYTGYSVKTLPGVREAVEQGRWAEAEAQAARAAETITALADLLGRARQLVDSKE